MNFFGIRRHFPVPTDLWQGPRPGRPERAVPTRADKATRHDCITYPSGSGHIAGVINPPPAKKYGHWVGRELPKDPRQWLAAAEQRPGSWWPEWAIWVADYGGDKVPARTPDDGALRPIEDAPGSYVRLRGAVTAGE